MKGLVLDCGGVMVNEFVLAFVKKLVAKYSVSYEEALDLFYQSEGPYLLGKMSGEEFFKRFAKQLAIPTLRLMDLFLASEQPNKEMFSLVEKLKNYKLAMLSDNFKEMVERIVPKYHLDKLFDHLIFSNEVGMRKPNPKIYQMILERLGLSPEECLFIDDHEVNLEGARELGIDTVLFTSTDKLKRDLGIRGIRV